jgi:AcrR family transcriptional regulator
MSPRPAPDLDLRRRQVVRAARDVAETDSWAAVTMRDLARRLGMTQPALYTVFSNRQAIVDAVALEGFDRLASALAAAGAAPLATMHAYLDFAQAHPRTYEAMFALPLQLAFAAASAPDPLRRAFTGIREAFPDEDGTRAEVAWSTMHGLATLRASGRLRDTHIDARIDLAHQMLTREEVH